MKNGGYPLPAGTEGHEIPLKKLQCYPADSINRDCLFFLLDLGSAFVNYTGPVGDVGKWVTDGDTDGDGDIDDTDLGTMFSGYTGPLAPSNVPEPASVVMLGAVAMVLARRRR